MSRLVVSAIYRYHFGLKRAGPLKLTNVWRTGFWKRSRIFHQCIWGL